MADVTVKVSADSSGVSTGLAQAQQAVNSFKETASDSIKDLGGEMLKGLGAAALVEGIKGIAEQFTNISKQSERFGESAETIQQVGQAAEQSGSNFETVAKAMDKVTINAVEAMRGNTKLADAFKELGIDAAAFVDLPMEEKLKVLADGYNKAGSSAEALTARQAVLGRGSAELTDLLKQGSTGLAQTFDSATVASQDTVDTIAEVTDSFIHMFNTLKVWGADAIAFLIKGAQSLGIELAAVTAYVENLSHGFKAAKEAYNEVIQAAADLQNQKEDDRNKKQTETRQGSTQYEEGRNAEAEADTSKKYENEVARLKEENAKKQEEAHIRSISLQQRQLEITKEIAGLKEKSRQFAAVGDDLVALESANKVLDLQKEHGENQKKIDAEKKKAGEEAEQKARAIKELELQGVKEKQQEAQRNLSALEQAHTHNLSVDSLRSIGGGYSGANYHNLDDAKQIQKEQVSLAKQQVEHLKQIAQTLENQMRAEASTKAIYGSSGDGSFTAP